MSLTAGAIKRYPMIFAFMVIIVIMGVQAYIELPRESSPDVKIPFVSVAAPYPGTSPVDMENLVTRKLEQQLKGVKDLEEMISISTYGVSVISLEFQSDVEISDALQSVRDRVELAKPDLPEDPRNDLVVQEVSAADLFPVMQVNLKGDIDLFKLKKLGEDLQEDLEQIPGVLSVDLMGGIENEVQVMVDPEKLIYHNLSLKDVQDAIALQNMTIPGGKLGLGMYDYQVRVPGEVENPEEILDFVLEPGANPPLYLRDVATVTFGIKDRDTISRVNGVDAVALLVKKRSGENIIKIAEAVKSVVEAAEPQFPVGVSTSIVADQSVSIKNMVHELENNILSGLLLVVLILLSFFGVRNAVFVGIAIPFSMLISFIVLKFLGITLNMVVLFSLILGLGMLVDNAIVIVENIFRHRGKGKEGDEAADTGTRQVATAVIASTLTTVCAFGPMVFWPGIMAVIITLLSSLLVALIFNPVLCARFMPLPSASQGHELVGDKLLRFGLRTYRPTLQWALGHSFLVMGGMTLMLILVFLVYDRFNHGVEFFPETDPHIAAVNIAAPSGTRIEATDQFALIVEREVDTVPDLKAYNTVVGAVFANELGSHHPPSHQATVTMEFVDLMERSRSSNLSLDILRDQLTDLTGATITVEKREEGPPQAKPVNIEISGDDFQILGELAAKVRERIKSLDGLVDIDDNFDNELPELLIEADVERAGRYGLRTFDIAGTMRTALHGSETAKYRTGEDEYDIVVRYAEGSRRRVEDLENMTVFHEGRTVPLSAFSKARFTNGLAAVHRIDAQRVVTVTADVLTGYNEKAQLALVQERLADLNLPAGYSLAYTGKSEDEAAASVFLKEAFSVAIMLIFVVLVSQFSSITVPLVIIFSVLLSLIGVLTGLLVTGTPFGIVMTGVGVVSLAGIVVNNAIVLLDYIIQLRNRGMDKMEAIMHAGETRFRPVVLTALTTILGLIPLTTGMSLDFTALFAGNLDGVLVLGSDSSAYWGPMGVAVIWGLAVATFLTLVVVPVMYSTLEPIKRGLTIALTLGRRGR